MGKSGVLLSTNRASLVPSKHDVEKIINGMNSTGRKSRSRIVSGQLATAVNPPVSSLMTAGGQEYLKTRDTKFKANHKTKPATDRGPTFMKNKKKGKFDISHFFEKFQFFLTFLKILQNFQFFFFFSKIFKIFNFLPKFFRVLFRGKSEN